jgi:23S rRNA (uracil1939-C5)-methyltransferase
MRKKQKTITILENIAVENYASDAKFMSRIDGKPLFIEGPVMVGDIANIQVLKQKESYTEGKLQSIIKPSADRAEPFCSHFGTCGGCKFQHIPYPKQLEMKENQVLHQLKHLAKVPLPNIEPIMGSAKTQYYRNKLEFAFSNKKWLTSSQMSDQAQESMNALGFHIPKRFDKILDLDHCYLMAEPANKIRNAVKKYADEQGLVFFDPKTLKGFLRNLIIRNSNTGNLMVIVQFADDKPDAIEQLMSYLKGTFPEISSLNYIINTKGNDTFLDLDVHNYHGKAYMEENMNGVVYRISAKSFFQTNSEQALILYKIALDYAQLAGHELVYDLYTGTGTIANFVAKHCHQVIGVEYVEQAIADAKLNSDLNGIQNTKFFAGDMRKVLTPAFVAEHGQPDVIITDPPRAGMDADVINTILDCAPAKIVYISCNPATQARDIALLSDQYTLAKVQPVDMFPHTHHVENVALLLKKQ